VQKSRRDEEISFFVFVFNFRFFFFFFFTRPLLTDCANQGDQTMSLNSTCSIFVPWLVSLVSLGVGVVGSKSVFFFFNPFFLPNVIETEIDLKKKKKKLVSELCSCKYAILVKVTFTHLPGM
jgi:hypothetical protein